MKKIICTFMALMALVVAFAQTPNYQGIVYVTPTGAGTHSGDSWDNATASIADAQTIAQANNCVVWVAAGTYYGDTTGIIAFTMVDGVNVYGGFAGSEPADYDLSLRDFVANETILDGDSARVVLCSAGYPNDTTTWDGLTIRKGLNPYLSEHSLSAGGVSLGGKTILRHCNIYNNVGGVDVGTFETTSIIEDCYIHDNHAANGWASFAGIFVSCSALINNCVIDNNNGVGIYSSQSYACHNNTPYNVTNCQISNNAGTGIYSYGIDSITITGCQIFNNQDYGVYDGGGSVISDCQIFNNQDYGVYDRGGSVISDCQIYNNTWGGIYCYGSQSSRIYNCSISHNNGVGIDLHEYYGHPHNTLVSNCLISNNTGSGIGLSSNAQLVSSTIVRNERSGVSCSDSYTGKIENCIVWGNVYNGHEHNITIDTYCEQPNCRFSAIGGGFPGEGNISLQNDGILQPYFVNPSLTVGASDTTSNVDWHLLPNSVCINKGNNAAVIDDSDLDGTARIKLDTVDMGCYESDFYNTSFPPAMPIVYVTPQGAGTRTGDSWTNATSSIDSAQAMALISNGVVWVAAGTYYGDTIFNMGYGNDASFIMRGVNVYGGFAGNEPSDFNLSQRDLETNATILDGQNARRVLYQPFGFDTLTAWDGFTIRNGKGEFAGSGAGAYLRNNGCLRNCVISHNEYTSYASHPSYSHGGEGGGGGVYLRPGSVLSNCLVVNNSSNGNGGGIAGIGSVYNSTIARNTAQFGSGILAERLSHYPEDTLLLSNCIVWGNDIAGDVIVSYSAIEGGYPGNGNITLADYDLFNPLFVNPSRTAGVSDSTSYTDWHLQNGSICINRGDNHAVFDVTDMQGALRIQQDTVDMGCYESPWLSSPLPDIPYQGVVFVTPTGSGTKTGESWSNAASSISFATAMAQMNDADVWVAGGTYYGDTTSSNAFTAVAGVNVYGGLAGDEAIDFDLSQRDIEAHATILDGQNRRRVLYGLEPENSVWDGFTFTHGRADYGNGYGNGGGVYFFEGGNLRHCKICHNYANGSGGGIYLAYNNYIENCLVANNSCSNRGGGIGVEYTTTITNTTITNNSCGGDGGGIWVCQGPATITNCLITGNVYDDEFYRNTVPDNIYECSSYTSLTLSYTAIENGYPGTHNIPLIEGTLLQPLFVNPSASAGINDETPNVNWHLQEGSICINRGNNAAVTDDVDLSGEERNQRDTVDVGCYESHFYRSHVNINEEYISVCDSCVWNDSVYYDEGLYTHTSNGINGYANVGVLHLTVNQSSSAEITVEANQNYNWHGHTYTESGDYTWTGQNAAGCDSVVTLHLTITAGITDNGLSSGFTLYPNPTTGLVTIRLSPETCNLTSEIHLFDIYGRRLQMVTMTDGTTQIDLSQYATGIYLVKLVNGGKVVAVRKVVKR